MAKEKIAKTNAMRLVEKVGVQYEVFTYPWKEDDLDARHVGEALERPADMIFKTLVAIGDKSGPIVAVIPSNRALDLKKIARASGNKRVDMLHLKDLEATTGYIRGGCSPIGMKRAYPTYVAEEINSLEEVLFSAGRRGLQMGMSAAEFIRISGATVADLTKPHDH